MTNGQTRSNIKPGLTVLIVLKQDQRTGKLTKGIVKDILTSKGICVGIPTINDAPYPSVGDIIYYLKGLRFDRTGKKKTALTFGSMGGRGGAVKKIADELTEAGFEVTDQMECLFVPDAAELEKCYALGKKCAAALKNA